MGSDHIERSYRLEPMDSSGIFLGLGLIQCALIGGGVLIGVGMLTLGLPLPLAAIPVVIGAAVTFTRIGGHATREWLPLLIGWWIGRLRRGRQWQAPLPLWPDCDAPAPMPPCLEGIDLVDVDWRAGVTIGASGYPPPARSHKGGGEGNRG